MTSRLAHTSLFVSLLVLGGCTSPAELGEPCTDSADCATGLSCFEHEGAEASPVCMSDCDLTMERLCAGGAVCTPADGVGRPAELGVCYLGGATAVGAACTGNLECVSGAICVTIGSESACYRACRTSDTPSTCPAGETCATLTGTDGFCRASTEP